MHITKYFATLSTTKPVTHVRSVGRYVDSIKVHQNTKKLTQLYTILFFT